MNSIQLPNFRKALVREIVGVLVLALALPAVAQEDATSRVGMPQDWSHRHLIYSNPDTPEEAAKAGALEAWSKKANDPRFVLRLEQKEQSQDSLAEKRGTTLKAGLAASNFTFKKKPPPKPPKPPAPPSSSVKRDWAVSLSNPLGGTVGNGNLPAKYTFDVYAAPSCVDDFVVFNTGLPASAATAASATGTFTGVGGTGNVVVNGTSLAASVGTAASKSTTITSNGVASGNTITVTNTAGTPYTVTASAPVNEVGEVYTDNSLLPNGTNLVLGNVTYNFSTSSLGVPGAGTCNVYSGGTVAAFRANLYNAIAGGGTQSTTTFRCASAPPNPVISTPVPGSGTSGDPWILTAALPGSTGLIALSDTTTRVTSSIATNGTDGPTGTGLFLWWSGAAAIGSTSTLAGNIRSAISGLNLTGAGFSVGGSGSAVDITATAPGLAGNNISVATTIASGAPFTGNLSGGASGVTSATTFSTSTDFTTTAQNVAAEAASLASAIGLNPTLSANYTATSALGVVTVTNTTAGSAGNLNTLTGTLGGTFGWTAFAGGADMQASILAFNQLYSTQGSVGGFCNQNGPSVMWAYQTGTGSVVTSTVLSLDGTKVAYVETGAANGASLRVLKWKAGQGTRTAPVSPDQDISGADWSTCTAGNSCIAKVNFTGNPASTNSSPFVLYDGSDTAYVGDDSGKLHKFTGVFDGTPQEVTTGGWPVTVSGSKLTSAVYDWGSGNIYVGDAGGVLRFVREVGSTVGTCAVGSPPCLATETQTVGTMVDGPIVDGSIGKIYAFASDATNKGSVYQFDTALSAGSARQANVGNNGSTATSNIHLGMFDQAYFESGDGTGKLYVCGKASTANDQPALRRVSITAGTMNNAADAGSLTLVTGNGQECSQISMITNPSGAVKASQTGTFTAAGGTGTVTVNGTVLTASPLTAASQSTTISANNVAAGNTITITNGVPSSTYTATAPTAETAQFTIGSAPSSTSSVTIGSVQYNFDSPTIASFCTNLAAPSAGQCNVRACTGTGADSTTQIATNLANAITNTSQSNSTWRCAAGSTPNAAVSATRSGTTISLTAATLGSTGFTFTQSGTTNFTSVSNPAGTDGSNVSPNFQYWSGAAAASPAQLATNIATAIGTAAGVGVVATNPSSGVVTITALAPGVAGNSINVATTIPSGLTGAAFNGNLTGGQDAQNTGLFFDTSGSTSTAAANLRDAINRNVSSSVLTASAAAAVVTVTATDAGAAGNSIGTTETIASGFSWGGATLTGGADSPQWLFLSVGNRAVTTWGCTNGLGCVMSLNLTGLTWPPTTMNAGYPVPAGPTDAFSRNLASTSGIAVDNVSSAAQASSIYFSFTSQANSTNTCNGTTSGGCALKLTQSGLQ